MLPQIHPILDFSDISVSCSVWGKYSDASTVCVFSKETGNPYVDSYSCVY